MNWQTFIPAKLDATIALSLGLIGFGSWQQFGPGIASLTVGGLLLGLGLLMALGQRGNA